MSELEQPLDEGDGVAMMESDFPEDTLSEKSANVVQVAAHGHWKLSDRHTESTRMGNFLSIFILLQVILLQSLVCVLK